MKIVSENNIKYFSAKASHGLTSKQLIFYLQNHILILMENIFVNFTFYTVFIIQLFEINLINMG